MWIGLNKITQENKITQVPRAWNKLAKGVISDRGKGSEGNKQADAMESDQGLVK